MKAESYLPAKINKYANRSSRIRSIALLSMVTLFVLVASAFQGITAQSASLFSEPSPAAAGFHLWPDPDFVDAPPSFRNMTDRSLRLDSTGKPRIAFGGNHLYYAWFDGTNWNLITIDSAFGVGEYASLAFDKYDRPRITYFDSHTRSLKFAFCNGGAVFCGNPANWSKMIVETPVPTSYALMPTAEHVDLSGSVVEEPFSTGDGDALAPEAVTATAGVGMNSSIAIGSNNLVQVSYYDSINKVLKYASWDGVNPWKIQVVDKTDDSGTWNSIALDYNNQPYIAYMVELYDDMRFAEIKSGSWKTYTIDSAGNVGAYTSLAIDSQKRPHISYRDTDNGNLRYAIRSTAGQWGKAVVDNLNDTGGYTSIDLKSGDKPCISYYDFTNAMLKFTCGDGWKVYTITTLVGDLGPEGYFSSLVIDSANLAHISYFSGEGYLKYASEGPAFAWSRVVVNNMPGWFAGNVGKNTSMVLDSADVPHISYFASFDNEWINSLKYATKPGATWNLSTLTVPPAQEGTFSAITVNSINQPRIAYYDLVKQDLKYTWFDGATWHPMVVTSYKNVGQYVSMGTGGFDEPHISYYNATEGDLEYAFWNGTNWITETVAYWGNVGLFTSLTMYYYPATNEYLPAVSYYDATEGNLMYAYKTPVLNVWQTEVADTTGNMGQFTSLVLVPDAASSYGYFPRIAYYDADNANLKYATRTAAGWSRVVVDSAGDVGQYTDMVLNSALQPNICYYDATNQRLKYATLIGTTWSTQIVDNWGSVGKYCSIDVTSTDEPRIAYYDETSGALKYVGGASGILLPLIIVSP